MSTAKSYRNLTRSLIALNYFKMELRWSLSYFISRLFLFILLFFFTITLLNCSYNLAIEGDSELTNDFPLEDDLNENDLDPNNRNSEISFPVLANRPPVPNDTKINIISNLANNTAFDLGGYECESRVPGSRCHTITDFSRFNYDPYNNRILMFGGGHSASSRTDIDGLDLGAFSWDSLYPSMTCEETMAENLDPRGFHIASGHPLSRHTYDMTVIVDVNGEGQMLLLSHEGFPGTCHKFGASMNSVASYDLSGSTGWSYSREFKMPWQSHAAAEFDPISGMVIIIGATPKASDGGMWVYNPRTREVIAFIDEVEYSSYENNLVFYPPTGKMYLFERRRSDRSTYLREINLDRTNWDQSRSTIVNTTGPAPETFYITGYAYDSTNQLIGGAVTHGKFHTFDPETRQWQRIQMDIMSDLDIEIGSGISFMLDYDPQNNVYYFISKNGGAKRSWAYRYKGL